MSDQNFSRLPNRTPPMPILSKVFTHWRPRKINNAVLPNATYSVNTLEIDHDNFQPITAGFVVLKIIATCRRRILRCCRSRYR